MSFQRHTLGIVLATLGLLMPTTFAAATQGSSPEAVPENAETEIEQIARETAETEEQRKEWAAATESAPSRAAALRDVTPAPIPEPKRPVQPTPSVGDLEGQLNLAQGLLRKARETDKGLEVLAGGRTERLANIPGDIERLGVAVEESNAELSGLARAAETDGRRAVLEATILRDQTRIQVLQAERSMIDAEAEWIQLQQDRAQARVVAAARAADLWTAWYNEERLAAEGDEASKAKDRLADLVARFPVLKGAAEVEHKLLDELTGRGPIADESVGKEGLVSQIAAATQEVDRIDAQRVEIERRMGAARERLDLGGLTEGMGATLQRDFEWLPSARALKAASRARNQRLSTAELFRLDLEDRQEGLNDLGVAADELLASLGLAGPAPEELRDAAIELLEDRRATSKRVTAELGNLHAQYVVQKKRAVPLDASAAAYREIIEEHILWVRGAKPFSFAEAAGLPQDVVYFAKDHSLSKAKDEWMDAVDRAPLRAVVVAALLIGLIAVRRKVKASRDEIGRLVRSYRTDRFWYTLRALVQTAILSGPWPLVLGGTAWLLSTPVVEDAPLAPAARVALYTALAETAAVWFVLRFVRGVAKEKGVGVQHFRWSSSAMALLRREIGWYLPLAVTFGFAALYLDRLREPDWTNSLGRAAFVVWMVALSVFLRRVLGAGSALWSGASSEDQGVLWRSRRVWSLVLAALPLALIGLSLAGYDYTALRFENRLRLSLAVALALVFAHALLLRWLFITRRKLAVSQALEAKERRSRQAERGDEISESGALAVDVEKVDIPAVDAQTRQLFKSGLTLASFAAFYVIWASTLPALRGFDRVQLYPTISLLENQTGPADVAAVSSIKDTTAAGASEGAPGSILPIPGPSTGAGQSADAPANASTGIPASLTLADLLMAIIFGILTMVAARNLPALLELTVLQRLPMDSGARYAVTTITRYVILVIGVSAVSGALGVGWQQIQFLAAALTFGLAFGLQEIFANFVSGLIILIERPVRVGDIVTVGGVEGRVTQLRMRATTILDWDRKESLIPNKQFITGNIINWTLSDSVTRAIIPVGVAYGSDTALTRTLLLQVAHGSDLVLKDPEPVAIFLRFGDSTLDFQLRVFIENRDIWPAMIDRLHTEIDAAFRKAKIEIAFPQRDIHIRSSVESHSE